ncbi:hypothetical protein IEQ34_009810 [Dendrobium chrysotoxum]|uniref:Uncharacterized protein n=1 Tax=Dendrobium chrysotoxum TaxID=161865 RepID=A0AAV7H1X7_DENCH|nr:hypothetical protein IEQ34_009810 [Dendrobium chrysotoxum]
MVWLRREIEGGWGLGLGFCPKLFQFQCSPKVSKPKGLGRRPINQRSDSLFLSALKSHWKPWCGCGEKSRCFPAWYEEYLLHHTSLGSLMVNSSIYFIMCNPSCSTIAYVIGLGSPLSDDVMDLYEKSCDTFALQYGDFVAHKKEAIEDWFTGYDNSISGKMPLELLLSNKVAVGGLELIN